jgi:membrane-bound ClpP family serine protease
VTSTIPSGGLNKGEIMVEGEAYHALSTDPEAEIAKGTRVVVVEYEPPRTVVVTPY